MARSKAPSSPAELLEQFRTRLENADRRPSIYRYEHMPQQELFHRDQHRNRISFGGNRGGKTYSGVADDVWILTRTHPYRNDLYADRPRRIRFIGVDFERGIDQTALPLFSQLIPPSLLINGSWEESYSASRHLLTLEDGSTCSFMSYEQDADKFQAVSLDHIHFDEEPPQPIFKESLLRLVDTNGGWTLTETPVQQMEWVFDELIEPQEAGERPDIGIFYLETLANTHLSQVAIEDLTQGMDAREKQIRLKGEYDRTGSMVFPEFLRRHPYVITAEEFWAVFDHTWTVYESMDYGYANPQAWLWTAAHPSGKVVTFDMLYKARTTVDEWVAAVKAKREQIGRRLGVANPRGWKPAGLYGDPAIKQRNQATTGTSIQQEYAKRGLSIGIEGIVKTREGNQNVGLNRMHEILAKRPFYDLVTGLYEGPLWSIVDQNMDTGRDVGLTGGGCGPLIREMRKARKPKQSLQQQEEKNASEEIRDKDNHAIDGVKYLWMMRPDLVAGIHVPTVPGPGGGFRDVMQEAFGETSGYLETHAEAFASIRDDTTHWMPADADPYELLD
jgi:phage terminase large subunit-like protein